MHPTESPAAMVFDSPEWADQAWLDAVEPGRRAVKENRPVLLAGEPGSGKWTFARAIHLRSARAKGPLVRAFLEIETEEAWVDERLAEARGGTLYAFDIARTSCAVVGRLAEAAFRKGGPRVIISTQRDAGDTFAGQGRWGEAIDIAVPSLRSRRQDLPFLFQDALLRAALFLGRAAILDVEDAVYAWLLAQPWPRNFWEMEEVALRAMRAAGGPQITLADLGLDGQRVPEVHHPRRPDLERETRVRRRHIVHMLREVHGDVARAADALGISRPTLYRRLKRFNIHRSEYDPSAGA